MAVFLLAAILWGCEENVLPKPRAMLRLEYARPNAALLQTDHFSFEYNQLAKLNDKKGTSLSLVYPEMKAAIFITYKRVDGNLEKLTADAQRLSYEHAAKADNIRPREYGNTENRVYGAFFEVVGNAASQAQFYATDSTEHFVTGSLYFATRPKYDSIYPAAVYLQQDIAHIMETLRWKE